MKTVSHRYIAPSQRLSSAVPPFAPVRPVDVSVVQPRGSFDFEEASKSANRSINLGLLKKHCFEDSLALLSRRAEILPERMAAMLDAHILITSETAEHLEQTMGLPAGWLDAKRTDLSEDDIRIVRESMRRKDEEAHEEREPVVFRAGAARPEPALPEAQACGSQADDASRLLSHTALTSGAANAEAVLSSAHAGAAFHAKEKPVKPNDPDLKWLKEQIDAMPRGTSSELARLMGRNRNDISAWLNLLRPMPTKMREPLAKAACQLLPHLKDEIEQRFHLAPLDLSKPEPAQVPAAAPSIEAQPSAKIDPAPAAEEPKPVASAVQTRRSGTSTYVGFKPSWNSSDPHMMRLIALQTAQTLAEVMKSVLEQEQQTEHH
ncbi:MAG: hypothetical protein N2690_01525 [Rhodocyclaceae bacterium]|nr:hypothetical protein [Rhodocyclaceae bacterium]